MKKRLLAMILATSMALTLPMAVLAEDAGKTDAEAQETLEEEKEDEEAEEADEAAEDTEEAAPAEAEEEAEEAEEAAPAETEEEAEEEAAPAETEEAAQADDPEEVLRLKAKVIFDRHLEVSEQLTTIFEFIGSLVSAAEEEGTKAMEYTEEDETIVQDIFSLVDSVVQIVNDVAGDSEDFSEITERWEDTKANIEAEIESAKEAAAEEAAAEEEAAADEETEAAELSEEDLEALGLTEEDLVFFSDDFDLEAYFDGLTLEEQVAYLESTYAMYEIFAQEAIQSISEQLPVASLLSMLGIDMGTEEETAEDAVEEEAEPAEEDAEAVEEEDAEAAEEDAEAVEEDAEAAEETSDMSLEDRLAILDAKSELVSFIVSGLNKVVSMLS